MAYELSGSLTQSGGSGFTETRIAALSNAASYQGGFFSDNADILVVPSLYGNQGQAGQGTESITPGLDFYTLSGGSWSFQQHLTLTGSGLLDSDDRWSAIAAQWVSDDEFFMS